MRCRARGGGRPPVVRRARGRRPPPPRGTRSRHHRLAPDAELALEPAAPLGRDDDDAGARLPDDPAALEGVRPEGCAQGAAEMRPALAPVAARDRKAAPLAPHFVEVDAEAAEDRLARRSERHRSAVARGRVHYGPPGDERIEDRDAEPPGE